MSQVRAVSGANAEAVEVWTLPEVAAYLRVSEAAVEELAASGRLPAQQIGTEWRFLKQAVVDWLACGWSSQREAPSLLGQPAWSRSALEQYLRHITALPPGFKNAVLKHFGVFRDDNDREEQLAALHAYRKADSQ